MLKMDYTKQLNNFIPFKNTYVIKYDDKVSF